MLFFLEELISRKGKKIGGNKIAILVSSNFLMTRHYEKGSEIKITGLHNINHEAPSFTDYKHTNP